MYEFMQAVAERLKSLFGGEYPVYWGRLPQGERRPCFYLPPVRVERRELACGRVWRQLGLELHFYAKTEGLSDLKLQEQVGERLLRELGEIGGRFRGRELSYQPGEEYLRFWGRYEYYTTRELEEQAAARELMQELSFNSDKNNNEK